VTSWKDEHGDELLFVSNKVLIFFFAFIIFQLYINCSEHFLRGLIY
jgi:hypothetical protein